MKNHNLFKLMHRDYNLILIQDELEEIKAAIRQDEKENETMGEFLDKKKADGEI